MSRLFSNRRFMEIAVGLSILTGFVGLIAFPTQATASAVRGIRLCLDVILPTLFPFFVLSTLIIQTGLARYFGLALERLMRPLFNVSGACSVAVALGFVGGYPVGAKTAISLYEQGLCSKNEAERLLAFCNNSGPAFILGAVGVGIFANSRAGLLLYLAHTAASLTVGFLFRFYRRREDRELYRPAPRTTFEVVKFTRAFTSSITSSFQSVLNICAFVIFFTVAVQMLFLFGILPGLAHFFSILLSPFGVTPETVERLLTGLIEITSGLWTLQGTSFSMGSQLAMAAFMLGWAGISVHCQVLSFIGGSGLRTWTYVCGKFLQAGLSVVYVYAMAGLFGLGAPVSDYLAEQVGALSAMDFGSTLGASVKVTLIVFFLFLSACLVLATKKHWKKIA